MEFPDAPTEEFDARLPLETATHSVRLRELTHFGWGTGMRGVLEVKAEDSGETASAEVELYRWEDLGVDVAALGIALDAWIERLRTTSVEALLARPELLSPWLEQSAEELDAAFASYRKNGFPEEEEAREARREALLVEAEAGAERLRAHIQALWGLQCPPLTFLWGFHLRMLDFPEVVKRAPQCRGRALCSEGPPRSRLQIWRPAWMSGTSSIAMTLRRLWR